MCNYNTNKNKSLSIGTDNPVANSIITNGPDDIELIRNIIADPIVSSYKYYCELRYDAYRELGLCSDNEQSRI